MEQRSRVLSRWVIESAAVAFDVPGCGARRAFVSRLDQTDDSAGVESKRGLKAIAVGGGGVELRRLDRRRAEQIEQSMQSGDRAERGAAGAVQVAGPTGGVTAVVQGCHRAGGRG